MELKEKIYPGKRESIIIRVILLAVLLGILFFQMDILKVLGREPHIDAGLNFVIGCFSTQLAYGLFAAVNRPRMRICDHFLLDAYDKNVISWNQVSKVRIKGNYLYLILPERRLLKEYPISIYDGEGFIDYVEDICRSRGIPLERVTASRGNEPGNRKEDVDGDGI